MGVGRDEHSESEESVDEEERQAKAQMEENIRKEQLKMKAERKIIVGSGFSFDMTDFFKFKKKDEYGMGDAGWPRARERPRSSRRYRAVRWPG